MGSPPATDRWQIDGSQVIDWHEWGDEFVVRVASRAETHLLSAAAGAVLLALLDGRQSLTLEALYARAFQDSDADPLDSQTMSASDLESLRTIVGDFEQLGIVTRAS
jgi:hypothetical protein